MVRPRWPRTASHWRCVTRGLSGNRLSSNSGGKLTPFQERAARALLDHDIGVLVAPPGSGKTVIGAWLAAARRCSTLILVQRQPLLEQWVTQLCMFLGIEPKTIGRIGGGRRSANGRLDVATIQSLVRKGRVDEVVARYGQVIVDESHHLPAVSFERGLAEVNARHVVGLTATPRRRDGQHPIAGMQLGPVRFAIDPKAGAGARPFAQQLIVRHTSFALRGGQREPTIQELYTLLARDEQRNEMLLDDVIGALEEGRSPILLTERRDHLAYLASRLGKFARHVVVLRGGMRERERQALMERIEAIPDEEERLVLATGRYIGEGFDDARLDTLFLALPISWKGTLIHYAGRLHRPHPENREVRIFDYVDRGVPMLERMFERRARGNRFIGYTQSKAAAALGDGARDLVLEYWDGAASAT